MEIEIREAAAGDSPIVSKASAMAFGEDVVKDFA